MYSCEAVWVKVLVSKGWLQSEITVQTLKWKKTNRRLRGGGGEVLRIWNFQEGKVPKNLKIFLE